MDEWAGIDQQEVLDRFRGCKQTVARYMGLMLADFEKRLPPVQQQIDAGNFTFACEQLHTMVGSASSMAVFELVDLCRQCELECKQGKGDSALASMARIQAFVSSLALKW